MIHCPSVRREQIRGHYDLTTIFYRLLWGRHIHHGLWSETEPTGTESSTTESPRVAQERLTQTLAREAAIPRGASVLDVGCGMGGSSLHLAGRLGCQVTGVTISPFQRRWAAASAWWHRVGGRTRFYCADAEEIEFPPRSFDVVWSVECTEHLFDKPRFFERAAQWVRPGGQVAVCAWLVGDEPHSEEAVRQVRAVCEGFFCPSLGTAQDYADWMERAGLVVERRRDWTGRVARTWEVCGDRVRRSGVRWLARLIDRDSVLFLDRFETILGAYRTGAMKYGCFVARRPRNDAQAQLTRFP